MKKLLCILLGCISMNVYAHNCGGEFDPISGSCRIIGPDGRQIIYNSDPPQSGNTQAPPPKKIIRHITVNVPSKYGALAANEKTGSVGGASNADSLSEAKKAAIRQCGEKGCKVITWARNGCIAAAGGKLGKHWKLSKAVEKPGESEAVAMKRCKSTGASNCQIIISESCSVPDGMYN